MGGQQSGIASGTICYLQHEDGCGQNGPNAHQVYGHICRVVVIRGVKGELLLQVHHLATECHDYSHSLILLLFLPYLINSSTSDIALLIDWGNFSPFQEEFNDAWTACVKCKRRDRFKVHNFLTTRESFDGAEVDQQLRRYGVVT